MSYIQAHMNNEEIFKENNGKKFDIILSNPPYSNKLHLQFLEKYCQIAKNIISIQPADWIFKNGKDKIKSHIKNLDYYTGEEFRKIFGIQNTGGGIFICDENGGFNISSLRQKFPIKKIQENIKVSFKDKHVDDYNGKGIFVPLKLMTSEWDKNKDYMLDKLGILKDGKTLDGTYYKDKRKKNKDRWCGGIYFETMKEAENFAKYLNSDFFVKYVNYTHLSSRYILKNYPYLEDYTNEWTNEMIYKYFNLTKEEQELIEKYAEKIWNRLNEK